MRSDASNTVRRELRVGPHRVEYVSVGRGPCLILVHGGSCSADDWANLIDPLSRSYHLILPDGLVHPLDPWALWLLADHLGARRAALIGHSAGGMTIRQMYRLAPQRVWALVSIDSAATGPLTLARKLPNDLYSPQAAALYARHRDQMQQLRPHHQGDYPSRITIERRMEAYRRSALTPEQRAKERAHTAGPPTVLTEAPPAPDPIADDGKFITCPTLVLHTGRGKLGPEDISSQWIDEHQQARDLQYVVIKEAGHWPWLEDRTRFLSLLEPFLRQHCPPVKGPRDDVSGP